MRFGGTIIVFALMLTGCGPQAATVESSPAAESPSAGAPASSSAAASAALLSLADACPKVQDALDAAFEDADPYDPGTIHATSSAMPTRKTGKKTMPARSERMPLTGPGKNGLSTKSLSSRSPKEARNVPESKKSALTPLRGAAAVRT